MPDFGENSIESDLYCESVSLEPLHRLSNCSKWSNIVKIVRFKRCFLRIIYLIAEFRRRSRHWRESTCTEMVEVKKIPHFQKRMML